MSTREELFDKLCLMRGRILSRFTEVEGIICNLITARIYGDLKKDNEEFRLNFLFDRSVRFFKKVEEFEGYFKDKPEFIALKEQASGDKFTKIRRLGNLRNFFAHARDVYDRDDQFKLYTIEEGKRVTSATEYMEFDKLANEVLPILRKAQQEIPYFKNFKSTIVAVSEKTV